jgi:hypothetical protein
MVFVVYFVFVHASHGHLNFHLKLMFLVVVFLNQRLLLLYIPPNIKIEQLVQPMLLKQQCRNYHIILIDIIDKIYKTKKNISLMVLFL